MKKFLYALFSLALAAGYTAQAQALPNLNLETWATRNGQEAPTNWQITEDIIAAISNQPASAYNFGTVKKTTDAHGGTYAAQLITSNVQATNGNNVQLPGYLVLGNRVQLDANYNIYAGLPYTGRPTQMQFYYKLTGTSAGADQAVAQIVFTRSTATTYQQLGGGSLVLTPSSTYTLATIPIQYQGTTAADSVTIFFTSGTASTITAGTTLQIDDITLSGGTLATRADASVQELLTVAPNPSPGGRFVISSPTRPALAAAPLLVLDALGRVVAQQAAQAAPSGQRELDLSSLSTGIYLLRLDSRDGTIMRQLTVK